MKLTHRVVALPCAAVGGLTLLAMALIGRYQGLPPTPDVDIILNRLLWELAGVGVVFCVVTALAAWGVARQLSEPLSKISSVAQEISDGDLSSAAESMQELANQQLVSTFRETTDPTGRLLESICTMTENLSALVGQVQRTSVQVISSSSDLLSSAKRQDTVATAQMRSMGVVGQSVKEITDLAIHLEDTFRHVLNTIRTTTAFASSGQTDLIQMRTAMTRMTDASILISDRLHVINDKTEAITSIVSTVTKVADQTNFLSLNALIEAERARDYGRSFMVIAREIRRLADQTAAATLDIETMVREMNSAVTIGVQEMEDFMQEMRQSTDDVTRIITKLAQIIDHVQGLAPDLTIIHTTVEQQSQSAQHINEAVTQLHQDMVQTRDSVQDSYVAIAKLNQASQDLQHEISRFQVNFDLVREFEIFRPFSENARTQLIERLEYLHFPPETTIVKQGEKTDSLYIIAKGVVSIRVQLPDGKSLEVARQGTGQIFGEISLLTGEPRTATVSTITDAELLEVRKSDIAPFIAEEPRIAEYLSDMLTTRKLDTAAKCNKSDALKLDRDTIYQQTLSKIQQFFDLKN
ncbi:methyl-accepting chemotaxis protein WspA [Gammaproteobacteria bacterium]